MIQNESERPWTYSAARAVAKQAAGRPVLEVSERSARVQCYYHMYKCLLWIYN